jgi:hypothetical protein
MPIRKVMGIVPRLTMMPNLFFLMLRLSSIRRLRATTPSPKKRLRVREDSSSMFHLMHDEDIPADLFLF